MLLVSPSEVVVDVKTVMTFILSNMLDNMTTTICITSCYDDVSINNVYVVDIGWQKRKAIISLLLEYFST